MKFTYETQGAITYLVCALEPTEQIDSLTLGMLSNNHIQGFAPVIYTEMNGQRFLKYNISAKVTATQFFSGNMNRHRTLTAFGNILNAVCSADEYMIDPNCFSAVSEHIFLNVSNCETALICIPVTAEKDINTEASAFFKKILFSAQFDRNEDAGYITQLITYLNSGAFTVYGFKDIVTSLQNAAPAAGSSFQQPAAPVSSFEATISIDDMSPSQGAIQQPSIPRPPVQRPPVQAHPPVQRPAMGQQPPVQRPSMGQQPPAYQQPPVRQPLAPQPPRNGQQRRPAAANVMPANNSMRRPVGAQIPPVNMQRPPVPNGPGFAIPGQPATAAVRHDEKPKGKKNKGNTPAEQGEKKMSLFNLLSNYNKENAAIYKAQKEAAKQVKNTAAPAPVQGHPPVGYSGAGQQQAFGRPPMNGMPQQNGRAPYAQPQFRPQVQPVPVQNSFNETTVLASPSNGETTLLSAEASLMYPTLMRVKTGERISINKPVFRVGKEKSYVDYFIADNTAISRSHCNIHTVNGEYFIEDTNSTNHTYINGKIINSNVKEKIKNGDKIRLANEDFTFSL